MCRFPGCKFKGTPRKDYLLKHMRSSHEGAHNPLSTNSIRLYYQEASKEEEVSQAEERNLMLLEAAGQGDEQRFKELISMGASVFTKDSRGTTAGDLAATRGHLNILRLIVESGMDVNSNRTDPWLHQALRSGHLRCAEFLLKSGADIEAKSEENQTAFEAATIRGSEDAMLLLKQFGADIHAGNGLQPVLHEAILNGNESFVALLLQLGAKVETWHELWRGGKEKLPLQAAEKNRRLAITKLLLDRGAWRGSLSGYSEYRCADSSGGFLVDPTLPWRL